jgi:hypothetical protein
VYVNCSHSCLLIDVGGGFGGAVLARTPDGVLNKNDTHRPQGQGAICDGVCPTKRLSERVRCGWSV